MNQSSSHFGSALFLLFSSIVFSAEAQPTEPRWDDQFSAYGVEGEIHALAGENELLYIGGAFNYAGGLPVYGIAVWDGLQWKALGGGLGSGYSGVVYALALDSKGNLYVGGDFDQVVQPDGNTLEASNLAMWNGSSWETLGTGVNDVVYALAVGVDDFVYIGGAFTQDGSNDFELSKIASWDGDLLNGLGDGLGTFGSVQVRALALDDEGNLFAGGTDQSSGIFRWNGQDWQSFGARHEGSVLAIGFDADGNLIAAGNFQRVIQPDESQLQVNRVARWNGNAWEALGTGVDNEVRALQVDAGGVLFIAGPFLSSSDGSINLPHVARWNGAWTPVGPTLEENTAGTVNALVLHSGGMYAGGDMRRVGGILANGVAHWNGLSWQSVGSGKGLDGEVYAMAVDQEGGLLVGGAFAHAGPDPAQKIARWIDGGWQTLGHGVDGGSVYSIAMGTGGVVYAAGDFEAAVQPDGTIVPVYGVARWDGFAWSSLGTGLNGGVETLVLDDAGHLYAGGTFTQDGSEQADLPYLAMWNGAEWIAPGGGMDGPVFTLEKMDNGTILAGGAFSNAGGETNTGFLAAWNGAVWSPLSETTKLNGDVYAIELDANGVAYVGGAFSEVEAGMGANYLARWSGSEWLPMGSPTGNGTSDCCVYDLAFDEEGYVYLGGDFSGVRRPVGPDLQATNIASWSETGAWQLLAEGVEGTVYALAFLDGDMYAGGEFLTAGGFASSHIARWSENVSPIAVESPSDPLPGAIQVSAIYPNPAKLGAELRFSLETAQQVAVDVYDTLGRRVMRAFAGFVPASQVQSVSLGSAEWPAGVYLVRITGEYTTSTKTVVWIE